MKNSSAILGSFVAAIALAAPAQATAPSSGPARMSDDGQWCPGQPWELEWGVNPDAKHCHSIADPDEDDSDLDGDVPYYDDEHNHPDGQYPPDYDWANRYDDHR